MTTTTAATHSPATDSAAPAANSNSARRPTSMRAAVHTRYGDAADVVAVAEIARPEPGPEDVVIEVAASSLNAIDHHMVTGTPLLMRLTTGLRRPKRTVVGADVAGTIVAVGAEVSDAAVGDEVVAIVNGGGCATHVVTRTVGMTFRPAAVSIDDAATAPVAGLTALQGLLRHGELRAGERVLINGAAGGVGTYAVQIAVATGAEITAVCSGKNVEMVRRLGAADVLDYTTTDVVDELRRSSERFDVIFDNVGNMKPRHLAPMLRPGGRVVLTTGPKRSRLLGPLPHMLTSTLSFAFRSASFTSFIAAARSKDLATLMTMIADGDIRPEIDRVVELDGVADGLAEIATGHARSKIVVHPA